MEGVIISIAFFASVLGIVYLFYTTRNKERMALIEKGADASLFNTGKEKGTGWSKFTLKIGMLSIGVALGIICGAVLTQAGILYDGANYTSMIFLFGGLSLVLYYLIDRKTR